MERAESLQSVNQLWDLCEDGTGPLRVLVKVADPPQRVRILLLLLLAGGGAPPLASQVQLLLQPRQPAWTVIEIRISVADPWHFGTDPRVHASDLWIRILLFLVIDLQDADKKLFFSSAYYFLKVYLHHISKIKVIKKSHNCRNQGFSYCFCLMIEGSGAGSVPLTNKSG